jgi:hypothetical protein
MYRPKTRCRGEGGINEGIEGHITCRRTSRVLDAFAHVYTHVSDSDEGLTDPLREGVRKGTGGVVNGGVGARKGVD